MDGHGELTTAQVADYLGVKPQTIYAYVSRGVLSPLRREPGTGSLFRLADVQSLVARDARGGDGESPSATTSARPSHRSRPGPWRFAVTPCRTWRGPRPTSRSGPC